MWGVHLMKPGVGFSLCLGCRNWQIQYDKDEVPNADILAADVADEHASLCSG